MSFHKDLTGTDLHVGPLVRVNSSSIGTRRGINFLNGTNVTITGVDDSGGDEVEITVNSSGGAGSGLTHAQVLMRLSFRM